MNAKLFPVFVPLVIALSILVVVAARVSDAPKHEFSIVWKVTAIVAFLCAILFFAIEAAHGPFSGSSKAALCLLLSLDKAIGIKLKRPQISLSPYLVALVPSAFLALCTISTSAFATKPTIAGLLAFVVCYCLLAMLFRHFDSARKPEP